MRFVITTAGLLFCSMAHAQIAPGSPIEASTASRYPEASYHSQPVSSGFLETARNLALGFTAGSLAGVGIWLGRRRRRMGSKIDLGPRPNPESDKPPGRPRGPLLPNQTWHAHELEEA